MTSKKEIRAQPVWETECEIEDTAVTGPRVVEHKASGTFDTDRQNFHVRILPSK